MLIDVPIGAWTLTIFLDLTGLLSALPQVGLASSITAGVGVAGALAAAAAGLSDWMDIDPPEKAIGAFHATANVSATVLFLDFIPYAPAPALGNWMGTVCCRFGGVPPGNDRRISGRGPGVLQERHDQPQCIPNWSGRIQAGCSNAGAGGTSAEASPGRRTTGAALIIGRHSLCIGRRVFALRRTAQRR